MMSILHREGYHTVFEPVLKEKNGDYMY